MMDTEIIQDFLINKKCNWEIKFTEECESTNEEVLKIIKGNPTLALSGLVLLTDWQSKGRGRRGSTWESNKSKDLLFSIAFSPTMDAKNWTRLTHATALGICKALKELNYDVTIKWPNDVYIGASKVAGILVESFPKILQNSKTGLAVIGVGLNVNSKHEDFSDNFRTPATSLYVKTNSKNGELNKQQIAKMVLNQIHIQINRCENCFSEILDDIKKISFIYQKRIRIQLSNGNLITGKVLDFGNEGEIIIEKELPEPGEPKIEVITSAHEVRLI
tara:strand:- start:1992 stop:2816 length:825 start_codon:yes stop_codon:yes gene_type:complete